ncbi:OmpH family outer membrane protein [Fulvivirgaceae bacterium BMA10]|uniref:OmpH family outer membrane protein n=1 Tax=Splendidivirga corallicola TaxID=3051826 RepID=A0ABT8KM85_9BACT|nr:OmpH family outer membrane protein [Fulvivirgaceae bacterium BMA10]
MNGFTKFCGLVLTLFILIMQGSNLYAQKKDVPRFNKWGYIDTDFILGKMPDYQKSQEEIQEISNAWREELKLKYEEIVKLQEAYQEEEVLLTSEEKAERINMITMKEDSLNAYRKQIFGFDGMFFQKKQEILKTAQDRLFDAIEEVAKEFKLHTLFDKAGDKNIIYVNPIHDYSDYVLEKLGLGDSNDTVK